MNTCSCWRSWLQMTVVLFCVYIWAPCSLSDLSWDCGSDFKTFSIFTDYSSMAALMKAPPCLLTPALWSPHCAAQTISCCNIVKTDCVCWCCSLAESVNCLLCRCFLVLFLSCVVESLQLLLQCEQLTLYYCQHKQWILLCWRYELFLTVENKECGAWADVWEQLLLFWISLQGAASVDVLDDCFSSSGIKILQSWRLFDFTHSSVLLIQVQFHLVQQTLSNMQQHPDPVWPEWNGTTISITHFIDPEGNSSIH